MKKKSQLFLFDAIIGFTLILIAFGVILTYYSSIEDNINIYAINQHLMNSFTKIEINKLNDEEIRDFFKQGYIKNIHNSVAQQTTEFYFNGQNTLAQNMTNIFVEDFITKQMNARILLYNETNSFELYLKNNREVVLENASIISSTKRSIIGFLNSTHSYGPYTLEIIIWQ